MAFPDQIYFINPELYIKLGKFYVGTLYRKPDLTRMSRKISFILIAFSFIYFQLGAVTSTVKVNRGERWWGVFVGSGEMMPFSEPFPKTDLSVNSRGNITVPFLISSAGRYIYSKEPFAIEFTGDSFIIDSDAGSVAAESGGRTLREAYLVCCHRNFPPDGRTPAIGMFAGPLYDLHLDPGVGASATVITAYADRILSAGYPAGTLVVPPGWQSSIGAYTPDSGIYPDFSGMVKALHDKGFMVMLTVTPFASGDGAIYRTHRGDGWFIAAGDGAAAMSGWDGGISACYDLTNNAVYNMIRSKLDSLHNTCKVDGFLFDCRNALAAVRASNVSVRDYISRWTELSDGFAFSQYTVSRGGGFAPYVHNMGGADFDTEFLRRSMADIVNAGMLGYPYSTVSANIPAGTNVRNMDVVLITRYLQLSAAMPVMNVPFIPWGMQGAEAAFRKAVETRIRLGEYIGELVKESAQTAEPVVRHMEYAFPRDGFSDCDDQFMIGSRYLVAPLLGDSDTRTVRFPRGNWTDAHGTRYRGPVVKNVSSSDGEILIFESTK